MTPLAWSGDIAPGTSKSELKTLFKKVGVEFRSLPGGFTYTGKIETSKRDYLFCNDHLYAIIEGGYYTGAQFNEWMQTFLAAHRRYGEPESYQAQEDWGQFRAKWVLDDGSTLFFQLQSDQKDQQGWSRQLFANDIGKPCAPDSISDGSKEKPASAGHERSTSTT